MQKNLLILFGGIAVIVVIGVYGFALNFHPLQGGVACTADAMQCPDGSWVGRSGPNCEFVCSAATSTATSTATTTTGGGQTVGGGGFAEYHSGIRGTVTLGPTCPVERNPPTDACADKPYATLVAVFRAVDPVHAIALIRSDAAGAFQVSLPPGDYVVGAGESSLPRCAQTPATVGPSGYTEIIISCDTGIR